MNTYTADTYTEKTAAHYATMSAPIAAFCRDNPTLDPYDVYGDVELFRNHGIVGYLKSAKTDSPTLFNLVKRLAGMYWWV